jgi:hypothetical protein
MNENIVDMGFFSQKQCVSPSMMCPDCTMNENIVDIKLFIF